MTEYWNNLFYKGKDPKDASRTRSSAAQKESEIPSCEENRRFSAPKGQMFIIAAILILVALVGIRNLLSIYSTYEEKRSEETFTLDKQLRNLKNEFRYITSMATLKSDANLSGIQFLYNFTNFTVSDTDARILYAFVFVNSSNQKFGVTIGNFLRDTINITINATNSTPSGYVFTVSDGINASREFQSDINGTVNITLGYSQQNVNITERFPVLAAQRFAGIFFDITLASKDEFIRSKDIYNRTW